jgi:hypothetical protein
MQDCGSNRLYFLMIRHMLSNDCASHDRTVTHQLTRTIWLISGDEVLKN